MEIKGCCSLRSTFSTDRTNELTRGVLSEEWLLVECDIFSQLMLPTWTGLLHLFYNKLFRHNGKGSPRQRHFKAIFRRGLRGGVAKKAQASGQTLACR